MHAVKKSESCIAYVSRKRIDGDKLTLTVKERLRDGSSREREEVFSMPDLRGKPGHERTEFIKGCAEQALSGRKPAPKPQPKAEPPKSAEPKGAA